MTLQEALRIIVIDESLEDFIYTIRDRGIQDPNFKGDSWDHPRVKNFSDAVTRLRQELDGSL